MILRNCWNSSLQRKAPGAPGRLAPALLRAGQAPAVATPQPEVLAGQSVAADLAETAARQANLALRDPLAVGRSQADPMQLEAVSLELQAKLQVAREPAS